MHHLTAGVTWVGLQLGDYVVEDLIGHGSFSDAYRARHETRGSHRAIKAARGSEAAGSEKTSYFPTRALVQVTGSIAKALPDTHALLQCQYDKLHMISLPQLIKTYEFVQDDAVCYYSMDFVAGETVRDYMQKCQNLQALPLMHGIAEAMHEVLARVPAFKHHGDLKPDNLLLKDGSIVIIDPGHFGELKLENGQVDLHAAVTTPEYYPLLAPDDRFAFGVMLWEACTGYHPLAERRSTEELDLSNISEDLIERIKMREAVGNYFLSAILALPDPRRLNPSISADLATVLYKSLNLKLVDGKLASADGFADFASIAEALAPFIKH